MYLILTSLFLKNAESRMEDVPVENITEKIKPVRWYCKGKPVLLYRVPESLYIPMIWGCGTKLYDCTETLIFYRLHSL